jgi:hypothetical protein
MLRGYGPPGPADGEVDRQRGEHERAVTEFGGERVAPGGEVAGDGDDCPELARFCVVPCAVGRRRVTGEFNDDGAGGYERDGLVVRDGLAGGVEEREPRRHARAGDDRAVLMEWREEARELIGRDAGAAERDVERNAVPGANRVGAGRARLGG